MPKAVRDDWRGPRTSGCDAINPDSAGQNSLQQLRHKHGVAKTPNASVSKSFLTSAPNERQLRNDHQALMMDVRSEAENYFRRRRISLRLRLRALQNACASRSESPATAESGINTALDVDDHLQRIVDSLDVSPERLVNLIQWEVVSNDRICRDLARTHEG
jgi:hypothetical protein